MTDQITSIQVLGSGCPNCKKLFELTKQAAKELNLNIEVEYITDVQKIIDMGMMSAPVLAINGRAILAGQMPSLEKIKEIIISSNHPIAEKVAGCCCGNC